MNFHRYVFSEPYFSWLLRGAVMTLVIAALTSVLALAVGIAVGMLRTSNKPALRAAGFAYILLFRNLPLLPFLLFLTFALPDITQLTFGATFPPGMEFVLLILGISLNTAGYIAEIFRSGIRAISREQYNAGRVLGLRPRAIYWRIMFPQSLRIAFPALGSRLMHNMKNSSLALVLPLSVGHAELMGQTARIAGQTFAWAEPLIFAACVYLCFAFAISLAVRRLNKLNRLRIEGA
jgi:His/Glu/Gln/Arg/opine family amino acid ABC transporter permease subunit